ncbi:hypothetical protein MC885_004072 [Smutsia gigantea]|nr:hypothetical protein MC885_004072 [Smutsia gigantea]
MALLLPSLGLSLVSTQELNLPTVVRSNFDLARAGAGQVTAAGKSPVVIQTDGAVEMQLLLLTVGLALVCGLQGQVEGHEQEELDPQMDLLELSGRWHTAALASNNSALIRPSGRFRVFVDRLDAVDGDLQAQILIPQEDQCRKLSLTAFKSEATGEFTLEYWGQNHLYLAKMKPTEFLILYMINQYEGTTSLVAGLLVRNPTMNQRLLPVFESVCDGLGLHKDQVMVVETTSDCRRLRD